MPLTEEQRAAITTAIDGIDECFARSAEWMTAEPVLQAMIDSSGTVEPTGGFDLEKARAVDIDLLAATDWGELRRHYRAALAEIERLRSAIKTYREREESAFSEIKMKDEFLMRQNARIKELEADNQNLVTLNKSLMNNDWILRDNNRKYRKRAQKAELLNKELKADLEQSERVVEARLDVIDQQAARIKELESSLDEAEALTKKNADLMNAYLARIAELEDALVEERARHLHVNCKYDQEFPCDYAGHRNGWCKDCDQKGKIRDIARRHLQAEGKIGPDADAKPRSWQITEDRVGLLEYCLESLLDAPDIDDYSEPRQSIRMLRAMLTEAGQE